MNLLNSATRTAAAESVPSASSPNPSPPPFPTALSSLSAKSLFFLQLSHVAVAVQEMETARRGGCVASQSSWSFYISSLSLSLSLSVPLFFPHCPSRIAVCPLSLSSSLSPSLFSIPRSRCGASLETRATSEPARVSSFLSRARPFQSARSRRNGRRDEEEGGSEGEAGREDRVSFVTR